MYMQILVLLQFEKLSSAIQFKMGMSKKEVLCLSTSKSMDKYVPYISVEVILIQVQSPEILQVLSDSRNWNKVFIVLTETSEQGNIRDASI